MMTVVGFPEPGKPRASGDDPKTKGIAGLAAT